MRPCALERRAVTRGVRCRVEIRIVAVARVDRGHRRRPGDAEGRVVETHTVGELRPVGLAHHVEHRAVVGERLEAVRDAGRDVDRITGFGLQRHGQVSKERRRLGAQVHDHVVHPPALAAHELRLPGRRPGEVQSAQRAAKPVVRDARLHHVHADARARELLPAPGAREEAALVGIALELHRKGTGDRRRCQDHAALQ
jgi:hypothetical protein